MLRHLIAPLFAVMTSAAVAAIPFQPLFESVAGSRWPDRAAQIKAESGFNPHAQSYIVKNGVRVPCARGLAQFTAPTWATAKKMGWVGPNDVPDNPDAAIRANHAYMGWLEARTAGRWDRALGAYNAGLLSIQRAQGQAERLSLQGEDAWLRALPLVTGAHAKETQGYVKNCYRYRDEIRKVSNVHP
jgi:soluble lytic murein transglycosylase-like protein